jgi:ATP-dependent helicase HrpA
MLEELRVSHFAQGLGVKGGASSKRIRRALAEA